MAKFAIGMVDKEREQERIKQKERKNERKYKSILKKFLKKKKSWIKEKKVDKGKCKTRL